MAKNRNDTKLENYLSCIKLVILDFDGTLFDTSTAIVRCLQESWLSKSLPKPCTEAIFDCIRKGISLPESVKKLLDSTGCVPADEENISELVKQYRLIYQQKSSQLVKPFPGVREFLCDLCASGRTTAIVSQKNTTSIYAALSKHQLSNYFSVIAGDLGRSTVLKPNPAVFFEQILPKINYSEDVLSSTLVVGDTKTDILFAQNLSARSCWVSYGYGIADECRKLIPDIEVASLEELRNLLQRGS